MSNYLSASEVTAAVGRVALSGMRSADMSTIELAAMGVWHGAAPDISEVSGPYLEDAFDLLERLSLYNVQAHRKSQRLGGSHAFDMAFDQHLPYLSPLQTRHYTPK